MADAPKKEDTGFTLLEEVIGAIILLAFLMMLWGRFNDFLIYYHGAGFDSIWAATTSYFYNDVMPIVKIFSFLVTALCIWGIAHAYIKTAAVVNEEKQIYGTQSLTEEVPGTVMKNDKWERVISHLNSANQADWRLAVLEADIMLDEMLKAQGYHGETLGERLKSIEPSDMLTLDNAWEAHRVRNQIAHAGADFPLSEREAKRAIALYESVFKEFEII